MVFTAKYCKGERASESNRDRGERERATMDRGIIIINPNIAAVDAMSKLLFSNINVARQVFYQSSLSFAIVNLKPLVPGRE